MGLSFSSEWLAMMGCGFNQSSNGFCCSHPPPPISINQCCFVILQSLLIACISLAIISVRSITIRLYEEPTKSTLVKYRWRVHTIQIERYTNLLWSNKKDFFLIQDQKKEINYCNCTRELFKGMVPFSIYHPIINVVLSPCKLVFVHLFIVLNSLVSILLHLSLSTVKYFSTA